MEVISVALTVCTLCKVIESWIEQRAEKEATITQISATVVQIRNILSPFASAEFKGTGEAQLCDCIRSIGDVLQRTKEHLLVWGYKRSRKIVAFLNPAVLVKQLRDDERQLNNQLIILLTSVAVVGYFRDHAKDAVQPQINPPPYEVGPLDELKDQQALEFWRDYIGAKITFIPPDVFCSRLSIWYNGDLSKDACTRIVMLLDEYNVGGITPNNLARALGDESLKCFLERCSKGEKPLPLDHSWIRVAPGEVLQTPLLVWIDDNPQNNAYEVADARSKGIQVIELSSTSVAKAWVEANYAFLRDNDNPSRVRFISDNVRLEKNLNAGTYLNPSAGESFLRYLRGRFFNAPVLIYTGPSIDSTGYIASLAAKMDDDDEWRGFKNY
ncbi:hypothetical protein NLJ89_g7408 [Agrocybe chaxingu]|uniref:Uncharacterized protein n=1 Tax=Agrocybe chaxingu TaxID=84603 RepID=A0A9W8JWF8_9AGAR|nr:hypothetical protein NLJ89_g7408 [Agrocybe chaxingu]